MRKQASGPLASLMFRPKQYRVEVQQEGEQILLIARRHPITNIGWILVAAIMMLASLGLPWYPFFSELSLGFQLQ
jgi:hypothetical protein